MRIREFASVSLDGAGYGTVRIAAPGKTLLIESVTVRATSSVLDAVCRVYENNVSDATQVDISFSGSSGDVSDTPHELRDGSALVVEWTGGDAGATATATWTGERF